MVKTDFGGAIKVANDTFWVGFGDDKAYLRCNPYLLVDGERDQTDVAWFNRALLTGLFSGLCIRKLPEIMGTADGVTVRPSRCCSGTGSRN